MSDTRTPTTVDKIVAPVPVSTRSLSTKLKIINGNRFLTSQVLTQFPEDKELFVRVIEGNGIEHKLRVVDICTNDKDVELITTLLV